MPRFNLYPQRDPVIKRFLFIFIAVLLGGDLLRAAVQGNPDASAPLGEATGTASAADLGTLARLIKTLQAQGLLEKSPGEIENLLVDSLLCETTAQRVSQSERKPPETPSSQLGKEVLFPHATLYLPVEIVNRDFIAVLRAHELGDRYPETKAVIVDLREASGIARPEDIKPLVDQFPFTVTPCAVLIDANTVRGAECLAAALARFRDAILLGQPTRGRPYRLETVEVSSSLRLAIPQKPDDASFVWPPAPLVPDISVAAQPPPSGNDPPALASLPPEQDPVLTRALDMMSMATVLATPGPGAKPNK